MTRAPYIFLSQADDDVWDPHVRSFFNLRTAGHGHQGALRRHPRSLAAHHRGHSRVLAVGELAPTGRAGARPYWPCAPAQGELYPTGRGGAQPHRPRRRPRVPAARGNSAGHRASSGSGWAALLAIGGPHL
jgi:hypothetical protein